MESDLHLKLSISLESIAVIGTAIHLWELPEIQEKISDHFKMPDILEKIHNQHSTSGMKNLEKNDHKWHQLKYAVLKKVDSLTFILPCKILSHLRDIICVIQEKIYCWYIFVMCDLSLDIKFARKIYWTCQGTIDEVRIFQEFWVNEPNFCSLEKSYFGCNTSLFTVACLFVQEDFIRKNSKEILKEVSEHGNGVCDVEKIIRSYIKFYEDPDEDDHWYNIVPSSILVRNGLCKIFKFLMQQSKSETKYEDALVFVAEVTLINIADCYIYNNRYDNEKELDRFLYCFKEMSAERKITLLENEISYIAYALLQVWPYQTFLFQIIDFLAKTNPSSLDECFVKILRILFIVKKERSDIYDPDIYRKVDDCMIMKIIDMMPRDLKRKTLLSDQYHFCKDLFNACDDKILRFILNDRDMVDLRDEILSKGDELFINGATKFTSDEMDNFLNRLGLTEAEKMKLKN